MSIIIPQPEESRSTVCSWCEPVNTARNHTICPMHEAEMMRQIEALAASRCEETGKGKR